MRSLARTLLFGLLIVVIAGVMTCAVLPFLDLSAWRIFRRCVSIAALISLAICLRLDKSHVRDLGLVWGRVARRELLFGLACGSAALGLLLLLGLATQVCSVSLHPDRVKLWRTVVLFIPAAFLVGIVEELVFRGYLLKTLSKALGWIGAVVLSSGLYAVVHLKTWAIDGAVARELVGLGLLGVVLAMSCLWSQRLWLAIGLHAVLAYGARVNKLVLAIPDSELSWVIGTSRLINGVASWVAIITMAWVLYLIAKRRPV